MKDDVVVRWLMCPGLAQSFCGEHKVFEPVFVRRERGFRTTREECVPLRTTSREYASGENDERGVCVA